MKPGLGLYKLVDGEILPCTIDEWGTWYENSADRIIAQTKETMVFGYCKEMQRRYRSLKEAKAGHEDTIAKVKAHLEKQHEP